MKEEREFLIWKIVKCFWEWARYSKRRVIIGKLNLKIDMLVTTMLLFSSIMKILIQNWLKLLIVYWERNFIYIFATNIWKENFRFFVGYKIKFWEFIHFKQKVSIPSNQVYHFSRFILIIFSGFLVCTKILNIKKMESRKVFKLDNHI